jgi:hypothetical protein
MTPNSIPAAGATRKDGSEDEYAAPSDTIYNDALHERDVETSLVWRIRDREVVFFRQIARQKISAVHVHFCVLLT